MFTYTRGNIAITYKARSWSEVLTSAVWAPGLCGCTARTSANSRTRPTPRTNGSVVWAAAKFEEGAFEAMCDMCVANGCVYQEGECRAECRYVISAVLPALRCR